MNQRDNVQEITLMDLFAAIGKKWKMLLCLTLAALLIGGAIGVVGAILSNRSYGTKAEFYVYSEKANKYILSLIKSDSFAEAVLMDENGLPEEYKDTDEYKAALEANNTVVALEEEIKEKEKALTKFDVSLSNLNKASTDAQAAYTEIYNHLSIMYSSMNAADYKTQIDIYENKLLKAKEEKDAKKKEYNDKLLEKQDAEQEIKDLKEELEESEKLKDETYDKVMAKYRNVSGNSEMIQKVKKSVTYSYAEADEDSSQALLYAEIAVPKDKEFASFLLDSISEKLPEFIEDNVEQQEVSCEYIGSFSSVERIKASNPISNAVKYGVIAAVAVCFVTCCVIVVPTMMKPANAQKCEAVEESEEEKVK